MKDSDLSTTAARDAARIVWFKRYPAKQTLIAFLLALLATTAFSIDPAPVSSNAVLAIDPKASGILYVCYEVLLSFAGHTDAVMLLALACLLTLPFRYVFFGRGDAWRPSVVLPSLFFAICMVFGRSYDLTDSAEIVLGDKARVICAWISGAGWMLLAIVAFYLTFEFLDWLSSRRIPFSEAHFGRVWRAAHAVLSVHPFAGPFLVLMLAWAPTLMGDTGAQIRQWFNYPNGTSDYLRLLNPNVLLNGHHPVVHTAIIGSCVQLGLSLFNSANAGLAIYTCAQFVITAACMAYSISSLRKLGVSLPVRGVILVFFVFMPMFSNYAAPAYQRCAVCRRVFGAVGADREVRGLRPAPSRCQCRACGRTEARALCAPRLAAARSGRHGFHVSAQRRPGVSPGGMRNRGGVLRMGRACGSSRSQAGWCCAFGRHPAFPLGGSSCCACTLPCLQYVLHQGLYAGARHHAWFQA